MSIGLIGRKCGMTRLYTPAGESIPVTVVEVVPNRISQVKTLENDGYRALQVTTGNKKPSRINKAAAGHFAKANIEPGDILGEFRIHESEMKDAKTGDLVTVEIFKEGQKVDVRGVTKGRGFAGVIKRHNFQSQDATHGNSLSHRAPGSIGQRQTPGRVFKGKRMAGHMGSAYRTIQNQVIAKVDTQRNLLLIKGAIPGAPGLYVVVTPAIKHEERQ